MTQQPFVLVTTLYVSLAVRVELELRIHLAVGADPTLRLERDPTGLALDLPLRAAVRAADLLPALVVVPALDAVPGDARARAQARGTRQGAKAGAVGAAHRDPALSRAQSKLVSPPPEDKGVA